VCVCVCVCPCPRATTSFPCPPRPNALSATRTTYWLMLSTKLGQVLHPNITFLLVCEHVCGISPSIIWTLGLWSSFSLICASQVTLSIIRLRVMVSYVQYLPFMFDPWPKTYVWLEYVRDDL
jgi:hypothetical protein